LIKIGEVLEATAMSEEEKDQTVYEEDDQGNILVYPAWNKKMHQKTSRTSGKFQFISDKKFRHP
jgi:hypothetical protein